MRKISIALVLTLALAGHAAAQSDTSGYRSPNQTTTPTQRDYTTTETTTPMPSTASPVPLAGMAGALALAAGIWLTSERRRAS